MFLSLVHTGSCLCLKVKVVEDTVLTAVAETAEVEELGEMFLYALVFVTLIHERLKKGSEEMRVSQLVS